MSAVDTNEAEKEVNSEMTAGEMEIRKRARILRKRDRECAGCMTVHG